MELQFSEELQRHIFELVNPPDRKWLMAAAEYVRLARRGFPPDFPDWDDDVTIDHILHFINMCKLAKVDASLDDRNILSAVKFHVQSNPLPVRKKNRTAPPVAEPAKVELEPVDVVVEMTKTVSVDIANDLDDKMIEDALEKAMTEHNLTAEDREIIKEIIEEDGVPVPVKKKRGAKKKTTKKRVAKNKTTKKRTVKKK